MAALWILFLHFFSALLCFVHSRGLERHIEPEVLSCLGEDLNIDCGRDDEVAVITHAHYGRMQAGNKCVDLNYGHEGCGIDVKEHLHHECSGKRRCQLSVADAYMERENGCPADLRTYLNVTYKCVKVELTACQQCDGQARVTSQEGYLASSVTSSVYERCGTAHCPWTIEVNPGQKIVLTLFDFGFGSDKAIYNLPDSCPRYAVIREKAASRDEPVCAGVKHHWEIYTSVTNALTLTVVSPEVLANQGRFLIHYEAKGCPDKTPKANTRFRRQDDTLEVECETNEKKWTLQCEGHEWIGEEGSCPEAVVEPSREPPPITNLPVGVLVAIVIAIALVIGSCILTVGIVCLKRYHHSHPYYYRRPGHDYDYPLEVYPQGPVPGDLYEAPAKTNITTRGPSKYQPVLQSKGRNWYQHRNNPADLQARPLPALPNIEEVRDSASTLSRSDDDPQTLHTAAEVHCSAAERRYLTNPRPSSARAAHTGAGPINTAGGPLNRRDPQYFMLEHNRGGAGGHHDQHRGGAGSHHDNSHRSGHDSRESKSDDPAFHALQAMRRQQQQQKQQQQQAINSNKQGAPSSGKVTNKPEIAPKPKLKLDISGSNAPASKTGVMGVDSCSAHKPVTSQKSPEEENAENCDKEVTLNSSCHEIPLRPSRFTVHNVNNTRTENTTGKTSWP